MAYNTGAFGSYVSVASWLAPRGQSAMVCSPALTPTHVLSAACVEHCASQHACAPVSNLGTEYNPNFTEEFNRLVGPQKDKKLVVLDDSVRGTLVPTQAFPEGKVRHGICCCMPSPAYISSLKGWCREWHPRCDAVPDLLHILLHTPFLLLQ